MWRFHAFFTTTATKVLDTVAADKTHRHHAVIEQVHADLKESALAHLPVFTANAAWLVLAVIAFNFTCAAGTVAAPDLARATTATIRRKLITVPARVATSARRITLHLPQAWPWEVAWAVLFDRVSDPPSVLAAWPPSSHRCATRRTRGRPGHRGRQISTPATVQPRRSGPEPSPR